MTTAMKQPPRLGSGKPGRPAVPQPTEGEGTQIMKGRSHPCANCGETKTYWLTDGYCRRCHPGRIERTKSRVGMVLVRCEGERCAQRIWRKRNARKLCAGYQVKRNALVSAKRDESIRFEREQAIAEASELVTASRHVNHAEAVHIFNSWLKQA